MGLMGSGAWKSGMLLTGGGGKNFFANSMAKWAQAGPSSSASLTFANTVKGFSNVDMIYVNNILGTNGVLTSTQGGALSDSSSENSFKLQITTAPTAAQANGCEAYWFIDDLSTAEIIDQFSAAAQVLAHSFNIIALGNVTQIGIQPFYSNTLNTMPATSIGTEQLYTVNSSSPTQITGSFSIPNGTLAIGDTLAYRIRITAVSTGHVYDINNGFQVGRALLNYGSSPGLWVPYGGNWDTDLKKCYRLYQKTAELGTNPQSGSNTGQQDWPVFNNLLGTGVVRVSTQLREVMMQVPIESHWDYNGTSGNFWYLGATGTLVGVTSVSGAAVSTKSMYWTVSLPATAYTIITQWAADARPQN
jgi:hypothetical protein